MEVDILLDQLIQNKSAVIEVLSGKDNKFSHFDEYFLIREKYLSEEIDTDFERVFCNYYIMNGARGLNQPQKDEFFRLLVSKETELTKILCSLYEIPGYRNRHSLFLSFGTKLLHTVNEELPIYDRNVAYVLELTKQIYTSSLDERIRNRVTIYDEIRKCFQVLLSNTEVDNYLLEVRREFQQKAEIDNFHWQDEYLSDTKLLDSLLWAIYPILK